MKSKVRFALIVVLVSLAIVVCGAGVLLFPFWRAAHNIKKLNAVLASPANYQPAAIALARLCETDPRLLAADMGQTPPDWTPLELGRLGPLDIDVQKDAAFLSTTSGLAEFNGYRVDFDAQASDAVNDAWTLTFDGMPPMGQVPAYRFTIPKGDGFTEEELVSNAWKELNRRKAAQAAGTDLAISTWSNPAADMSRLIAQHRSVAEKLGLAPATQPATHP